MNMATSLQEYKSLNDDLLIFDELVTVHDFSINQLQSGYVKLQIKLQVITSLNILVLACSIVTITIQREGLGSSNRQR